MFWRQCPEDCIVLYNMGEGKRKVEKAMPVIMALGKFVESGPL